MARLRFADLIRDIDLVVFDKDGTLIDFDFTWAPRCIAAVDALIAERPERQSLRESLLTTIGIDPRSHRALPESPLVVGTVTETAIVAATVLHQSGETWTEAMLSAERHVRRILTIVPAASEIRAFPAVVPLFGALRQAGVALAVLTNDDRASTLGTLDHLGLLAHLTGVGCADDAHAGKPEPHGLLHLAALAGVPISRVAMVGDAIGDLVTAQRAGGALAVAVLSGAANHEQLVCHADVVLNGVGEIEVADG